MISHLLLSKPNPAKLIRLWAVVVGLYAPLALAIQTTEMVDTIAFGSCLRQYDPQPIWNPIIANRPDIFLFIGDNIYADTQDIRVMREKYAELGAQAGYQKLRTSCPVHATWDDHDYGANDAGAEFPMRAASKEAFMEFFEIPPHSPMRTRDGVYDAHVYGPRGRRVQIILLDTRYFRSPLKPGLPTLSCPRVRYLPNDDPEATLLGEAQWAWLEKQMKEPAELRVLASSIQVIPDQHCFEKWGNFPRERERLFELIRKTQAKGVVLISGDRHFGDISRLDQGPAGYPLYELTSSGMNSAGAGWKEVNSHRAIEESFHEDNFGLIKMNWAGATPTVRLELRDVNGNIARHVRIPLESLH